MEYRSLRPLLLERRARRRDLIRFLEALALFLQCGFDLSYSWPTAIGGAESVPEPLRDTAGEGMAAHLTRLSETYPDPEHRLWFSVLRQLYEQGAGLTDAVLAIGSTLREEQNRDWERHCRTLPTKINVLLILFFLPPTLVLLFVPLLAEVMKSLAE